MDVLKVCVILLHPAHTHHSLLSDQLMHEFSAETLIKPIY